MSRSTRRVIFAAPVVLILVWLFATQTPSRSQSPMDPAKLAHTAPAATGGTSVQYELISADGVFDGMPRTEPPFPANLVSRYFENHFRYATFNTKVRLHNTLNKSVSVHIDGAAIASTGHFATAPTAVLDEKYPSGDQQIFEYMNGTSAKRDLKLRPLETREVVLISMIDATNFVPVDPVRIFVQLSSDNHKVIVSSSASICIGM